MFRTQSAARPCWESSQNERAVGPHWALSCLKAGLCVVFVVRPVVGKAGPGGIDALASEQLGFDGEDLLDCRDRARRSRWRALLVPSADLSHELIDPVVQPRRLPGLAAPATGHEHSVDLSDDLMDVLTLTVALAADVLADTRGREPKQLLARGDIVRGRSREAQRVAPFMPETRARSSPRSCARQVRRARDARRR